MNTFTKEITEKGFSVLAPQFDSDTILNLESSLQNLATNDAIKIKNGSAYGIRNLLNLSPAIRHFTEHDRITSIVESTIGPDAKVVRAIYFNKTPAANWKVAWHQDLTIAVRKRIGVEGFTAWSTKAGVVHVQPPISILEKMLTLRISLDNSDESNGALRVIPGSHTTGRLYDSQIKEWRESTTAIVCNVERGGVLVMRPLLLHSSSISNNAQHRRVVHLEFSANDLSAGLEWFGS